MAMPAEQLAKSICGWDIFYYGRHMTIQYIF